MNEIFTFNGSDVTMNVCLSVLAVTRCIARKDGIFFEEAMLRFANSKTCETLHDCENGLWAESPEYIASLFYEEQKQSA